MDRLLTAQQFIEDFTDCFICEFKELEKVDLIDEGGADLRFFLNDFRLSYAQISHADQTISFYGTCDNRGKEVFVLGFTEHAPELSMQL